MVAGDESARQQDRIISEDNQPCGESFLHQRNLMDAEESQHMYTHCQQDWFSKSGQVGAATSGAISILGTGPKPAGESHCLLFAQPTVTKMAAASTYFTSPRVTPMQDEAYRDSVEHTMDPCPYVNDSMGMMYPPQAEPFPTKSLRSGSNPLPHASFAEIHVRNAQSLPIEFVPAGGRPEVLRIVDPTLEEVNVNYFYNPNPNPMTARLLEFCGQRYVRRVNNARHIIFSVLTYVIQEHARYHAYELSYGWDQDQAQIIHVLFKCDRKLDYAKESRMASQN